MMETREIVEKVLGTGIKLCLGDNEFKVRGPGFRRAFTLNAESFKNFVASNYDFLSKNHNGNTTDLFSVVAKPNEEVDAAIEEYKESKKTKRKDGTKVLQHIQENLTQLVFSSAKSDKDRYLIFDTKLNKLETHYDIKLIQQEFNKTFGSDEEGGKREFAKWASRTQKVCTHSFYQNKPKIIPISLDLNKWEYNNYDAPEYLLMQSLPDPTPEEVKIFGDYFKHLIPNEKQRDYVFSWMYHSLADRNHTFLCLIGAHGVGKTLLMDFLTNLHGPSNAVRPKNFKSNFNGYLASKSLVIHDEVKIEQNGVEEFKRFANNIIQIENKGEDQRDVRNSASIVIASNYVYNILVTPSDRRFSLVDLGKKKLQQGIGQAKTDALFKSIDKPHILKWFRGFLKRKYESNKDFNPNEPLKDTKTYELCCNVNAPHEVKFTMATLKEKDSQGNLKWNSITMETLIKKYKVEQKKEGTNWKRISKHSLFFSKEIFHNTVCTYTIDGEKIMSMEGDVITNLIGKGIKNGNGSSGNRTEKTGNEKTDNGDDGRDTPQNHH